MTKCLEENSTVNKIFGIFLQVTLIFVFLTIFFFSYVGNSEKDSFKLQMNIVVDDLAPDMDVRDWINPKTQDQKDIATAILEGSLELARKNSEKDDVSEDQAIKVQNKKIMDKAYLWMGIALGVMALAVIILVLMGKCVPFHIHLKEAAIVVFFVAMTELIFLTIITKKYWSVDPSQVRNQLGDSIQKWIQIHHPVKQSETI